MEKKILHILHVEDNDINSMIFHKAIRQLFNNQHVVHRAVNAHEALQHLSVVTYNIIFIDLRLPGSRLPIETVFAQWLVGGDYLDKGERIIKYCFDNGIQETSKVIVCSALGSEIDKLVEKYGTLLYKLEKPFRANDLIKIVESSISS